METKLIPDLSEKDIERIRKSGIIALDTETGGLIPSRDSLFLVQICDKNGVIDLIKNNDWPSATNLKEILLDKNIVKVIHFAIMDCAFLLNNLGVIPQNLYCTKIASKIARTYASSHTLSVLCEDLLGVILDKKQQTTFWGKDPLTDEQLSYAANDVIYLLDIKSKLDEILYLKCQLPSQISYVDLNKQCQSFIPTLIHLWSNGWDIGKEDQNLIFGR